MAKTKAKVQPAESSGVPPSVKDADPTNPKLTKALVHRLYYLNTERRRLDAQARQLATEEHLLRDVVFSWLEARSIKHVTKFGFRVGQKIGRTVVPWREAFVRSCGADAAAKLTAESPKSVTLEIEAVE